MKQGIYAMKSSDYHALPYLSASTAKTVISKSASHAKHEQGIKFDASSEMDIGTAFHALFLEGKNIVHVVQADDWRTKSAREERDDARDKGLIALLPNQYESIKRMVESAINKFSSCPDMDGISLEKGSAEKVVIWENGGLTLKSKIDWLSDDHSLILDLKSTGIGNPESWSRSIVRDGHDIQAAFYTMAVSSLTGNEPKFSFLVQETDDPYESYIIGMAPSYIELGKQKVKMAIDIWKRCEETGIYPGYESRIQWAEPPSWALADMEVKSFDHERWTKEAFQFGRVIK